MTMILALLTHGYAALVADTRSIVHGPAMIPLGGIPLPSSVAGTHQLDALANVLIASGEQLNVDGPHPMFDKIRFAKDGDEAFAFSGSRQAAESFLGWDGVTRSWYADQQIGRYFESKAALERVLDLPSGLYDSWSGLHVYRANGRSIAARFDASPFHLSRQYLRSRDDEIRYTVIGSGEPHVERALSEGPLRDEWHELARRTSKDELKAHVEFWVRRFADVAKKEHDVNEHLQLWVRFADEHTFRSRDDLLAGRLE